MLFRLLIAIIATITVTIGGHYYTYIRMIEPIVGSNNKVSMSIFLFFWALSFFGFLLIRLLPHSLRKFTELFMFIWMGCIFIYFIVCVLTLPIHLYFQHMGYSSQKSLSIFIFISGTFLTLCSVFQALRKPAIIKTTVPVPATLPAEVEDLTAVVISDIHVSGLIGKKRMTSLAQRVNELNPNFIFITGDLMDGTIKQLKKEIEPLINLKAKNGIMYVTGNHEYYSGPLVWKNHFEKYFKWNVLRNSSQTFEISGVTLNILGVEDKHWLSYEKIPRKNDSRYNLAVDHLLQQREKHPEVHTKSLENCLNILLAHQPKDAKYLYPFSWINLQVSGHTHGGQIWPVHYLVLKDQKYNSGLYNIQKDQYIYVNQGTGFWGPPMRIGSRSEITLMRFKRADA